jgi:hypothetical protein
MLIRSFAFINRFPLTNPSYSNSPFPFGQLFYCSTTFLLPSLHWFNDSITSHPHFSTTFLPSTKLLPSNKKKTSTLPPFTTLQHPTRLLSPSTRLPPSLL